MPLTPRHQILLALFAIDDDINKMHHNIRRAAWFFTEFNVVGTLNHLQPVTALLATSNERCRKLLDHINIHMPTPSRERLPEVDTIQQTLVLALEALNSTRTFKVPARRTDSAAIAAQLTELIQQLGGKPHA